MKRITLAIAVPFLAAFALAQVPATKPAATTKPAVKKFPYLSDKMNETVQITRAELAAIEAGVEITAKNITEGRYHVAYATVTLERDSAKVTCYVTDDRPTEPENVKLATEALGKAYMVIGYSRNPDVKSFLVTKTPDGIPDRGKLSGATIKVGQVIPIVRTDASGKRILDAKVFGKN